MLFVVLMAGNCSANSFTFFEKAVLGAVRVNGKRPMGWEEMYTTTRAASPVTRRNVGQGFVLATWSKFNAVSAARAGFDAVESAQGHFYIQEPIAYSRLWFDIANATTAQQHDEDSKPPSVPPGKVIGGEVSLWGDPWCFNGLNCTRNDQLIQPPREAGWMYYEKFDAQFEESLWAMLLPRSVVGAASFWRFEHDISADDPHFIARYHLHAKRLGQRFNATRGGGCPIGCKCSAAKKCGVAYSNSSTAWQH